MSSCDRIKKNFAWSAPLEGRAFYFAGLLFVVILGTIYLIAGGDAVVTPHDQLDQFYMNLYVEHFRDGFAPELMNGLPLDRIQTMTWLFIPLYFLFDYAYAYLISYFVLMAVAYVGMALLCSSLGIRSFISMIAALLYSLLPIACTYGLSIIGIPLVAYGIFSYWLSPTNRNLAKMLLIALLYALGSDLVLIGYAVISFLFGIILFSLFQRQKNRRRIFGLIAVLLLLCFVYALENVGLFVQFFGNDASITSHREEFVDTSSPISFDVFWNFITDGQRQAPGISNQFYIVLFSLVITSVAFCYLALSKNRAIGGYVKNSAQNINYLSKAIICLFVLTVIIACFYVLFHSGPITSFRNSLPGFLRSFQFDRFYLLYPTLWYLLFGLGAELLLQISSTQPFKAISFTVIALTLIATLSLTLPANDIVQTLQRKNDSEQTVSLDNVTWNEFFSTKLFDEIKKDNPGIESDGKVVSVGLFPSIALFNGFSCLDGYLYNYPLEYKHDFREVIKGELDKSSALSKYYDNWGNRFYVFTSEHSDYFTLKNTGATIKKLDINIKKIEEMGGKYVISALPIDNANELGLTLLGEYEESSSPFEVWLYEISENSADTT